MYSRAELKQLKIDFWEGFGSYCKFKQVFKYRKDKFILYDTKLKGTELKFDATRNGAFVILEFNGSEEVRKERYEQFETYRYLFEEVFESKLIWLPYFERESGEQVARVYLQQEGLDIHRRDTWIQFYEFMAPTMQKMEDVFVLIKEYIE